MGICFGFSPLMHKYGLQPPKGLSQDG